MPVTVSLGEMVGTRAACEALAIPRATFYRHQSKSTAVKGRMRPAPPLALSPMERQAILNAAHEQRFWDATP